MSGKILLSALLVSLITSVSAQGNLTDMDYKTFRFGFLLGTNMMDLKIRHTEQVQEGKIYYADVSDLTPGFTVGLITDLRLHRYFDLRFTPTLLLGNRILSFNTLDTNTGIMTPDKKVNIFSLPVDFPLMLRYSAERWGNFRPYVQVGIGTCFDLGRDELKDVTLNLSDFYFTFGAGCDLYFRYFKLSPELRINLGQTNILTPKSQTDDTAINLKYTNAFSALYSRIVILSFNIE
jgi:hypothetical protein